MKRPFAGWHSTLARRVRLITRVSQLTSPISTTHSLSSWLPVRGRNSPGDYNPRGI
jgi:hypothetical protein